MLLAEMMGGVVMYTFHPKTANVDIIRKIATKLNSNMLVKSAQTQVTAEDTDQWRIDVRYSPADTQAVSRLVAALIGEEEDAVRDGMVKQARMMG